MQKINFLPSLTTVTMEGTTGDGLAMIAEIKKLGLKEIALFPTGLQKEDRFRLYNALKETSLESIPFVHLRTDMELSEIDFLVENFHTKFFNLHTTINWPLNHDYAKYAKQIFIENGKTVPTEEELEKFGGLCIDFSHWENQVLLGDLEYDRQMRERITKFPVGVCHISPIEDKLIPNPFNPKLFQYDTHKLVGMHELDYLKKYKQFIPNISAIELQNPINTQLEVKKYLKKMLG